MAWPPVTHQDVQDAVTALQAKTVALTTDPLAVWKAALANIATAPARILGIGDSIMEGEGATTRAGRWPERMLTRLRQNNPGAAVVGGIGYQPPYYQGTPTWATWATATTGTVSNQVSASLGYTTAAFTAAASRTYPITGDGFDLWTSGTGAFTYTIDGGSAVTVNPATGGARQVTAVSGLAAAAHSIVLTATAAFTLEGIVSYNGDRSKGIVYYDSAHSGYAVSDFLASQASFVSAVNLASPDLVMVELGANDAVTVNAATYQTNLQTLVTALQTGLTKTASILIISDYLQQYSYPQGPWSGYVAAAKAVAASSGVAYFDVSTLMPKTDTTSAGYYASNGYHLANSGAGRFANLVAGILDPTHATIAVDSFTQQDFSMPRSDWTVSYGTANIQGNALVAVTGTAQTSYNPVRVDYGTMAVQGDTEIIATVTPAAAAVEQYVQLCIDSALGTTDPHAITPAYVLTLNFNATASSSTVTIDTHSTVDTVNATVTKTLTGGIAYRVRFVRVQQQLWGKVWATTVPEPTAWDITYTITGTPLTGKAALMAQGGANTTARTFTFDDVTVY